MGAYVMRAGFQGMPYYSFYKDSKGTLPEIVQGLIFSKGFEAPVEITISAKY